MVLYQALQFYPTPFRFFGGLCLELFYHFLLVPTLNKAVCVKEFSVILVSPVGHDGSLPPLWDQVPLLLELDRFLCLVLLQQAILLLLSLRQGQVIERQHLLFAACL